MAFQSQPPGSGKSGKTWGDQVVGALSSSSSDGSSFGLKEEPTGESVKEEEEPGAGKHPGWRQWVRGQP